MVCSMSCSRKHDDAVARVAALQSHPPELLSNGKREIVGKFFSETGSSRTN